MTNVTKKMLIVATGAALLVSITTGGRADDRSDEQRDCTSDALRLCGQFVPDEAAITTCMRKNVKQLSPSCRKHFEQHN